MGRGPSLSAPAYASGAGPRVRAPGYLPDEGREDRVPVPAEEWLRSRYLSDRAWDTFWREETRRDWCRIVDNPACEEVVLDGSIGWGKTHFARALILRWVYELTCLASPGRTFLGNPASVVKVAMMSVKLEKSREILFDGLKRSAERVPYFRNDAPFNDDWDTRRLLTSMRFRAQGIVVEPVVSNIGSVISDDLICFVLDEANFLPRVKGGSRRQLDPEAASRVGDASWSAAREFIDKARTRMRSRFLSGGRCWAKLLVLSSSIDDSDVTLERAETARERGELGTKVEYVSRSIWEGKPVGTYGPETFPVDLGLRGRPPRVMEEGEVPTGEVIRPPVDLLPDFRDNPVLAVRELAGRRSAPRNVWLTDERLLEAAWDRSRREPCAPSQVSGSLGFDRDALFYRSGRLGVWRPALHPDLPRCAHVDLSATGDLTGVSVGCSPGTADLAVRDPETGELGSVTVPLVHLDLTLAVRPPPGGRIDMIEVEEFLFLLAASGMDLRLVTFDQYQSNRSSQQFERSGIPSRHLSVDRDGGAYQTLRRVLRVGGFSAPHSPVLERELRELLEDAGTGKVDHPPKGSKDVADSAAGVAHALFLPDYMDWAVSRTGSSRRLPPVPL
jgi:hypothetical protein